ncbi:unknown [Firmicutes bacterium CAG:449]|nr:unknown [Firmicutes bacterium CAG:449]
MVEASKVDIENKNTSTIEIEFESTNSLKIMTENKKVLYITNIEFFLEK